MVAHFHSNHNRPLNKHIVKITLFLAMCCIFAHFSAYAQSNNDIIMLEASSDPILISKQFAVYKQTSHILKFEEFVKARSFLPYGVSRTSNYGFEKNGVWLYARLNNQSNTQDWTLSIRFSQLQDVDLYVRRGPDLIFQGSDGLRNKTSPFALPSFRLDLPINETVEVYIYVRSSSMSLVAPIYMQNSFQYATLSNADYTIWGTLYGLLALLLVFALTFFIYNRQTVTLIYVANLFGLLIFQLLWSGHSAHLPYWISHAFEYLRAESIILLCVVFSTTFTIAITPQNKQHPILRAYLIVNSLFGFLFVFMFLNDILSAQIKLILCYSIAIGGVIANSLMAMHALSRKFFPARALFIGWLSGLIGSIASAFFIFGILPNNLFHQHLFNFSLLVQACAFLLSIVLRNQYDLELEVKEAQTDAENNFYLIEEQNVHLDIARKQAIKAFEVKSQFLANMSHEIRTPLHAILGFTKELESKQNIIERDEHVRIINSAANDLLTIVNDILDFSKMEAGKLTLNNKPFSPRDLLEDVAALMSKSAHLKQLEFILDVGKLPPSLIGDAFKVKQLLSNLLGNALKFTEVGYVTLKAILVEQDEKECTIEFQIEDTGIGINEADMSMLFTAFHQLDDDMSRSFQGTGLGLVICQELSSLMNGQIKVSSTPNKGSLFVAKIPFYIDNTATQLTPLNKFCKQTAVLVDDWAVSRDTTKQQLIITGFDVLTFDSVSEMLKSGVDVDYVFVSLPFKNKEQRPAILEALSEIRLHNLVLLYSGPIPNTQIFAKIDKTPRVFRLPLTTRKLIDINQVKNKQVLPLPNTLVNELPNCRILAVDDMELNLRLLNTWLQATPVHLDLAFSGEMAIQLCQQHEYDLILMDIQMPNMDGLETTRKIREIEINFGVPIIAVTAHALESEKQHFLDSGMDDFLAKPISLETLSDMIQNWCAANTHNETELQDSLDWKLALSRANNNKADALAFFDSFIESLQVHAVEIEQGWQEQRKDAVLASIHKLHGACCYTGVPRLQAYCYKAEQVLKSESLDKHSMTVSHILFEIEQLIADWPNIKKLQL